jgi:transposase
MRKPYPTDHSDAQWTRLQSCLLTPKAQGRPRTHSLRDVFDAIFYVLKAAAIGGYFPTTSLLGLPFTTISGDSD